MKLFKSQIQDYEVVGMFNKITGEQVTTSRICHNVSKKEATQRMKSYVQTTYADTLDLHRPIKINVKASH
ncbi:hypothetical protein HU830_02285 [Lactobacillus sp. DCY120]|uniref:Uncharacterized protein n=1 Tax=Bombilactobacillus apium TaxID=2675299 RepID=A0A850RB29_9LACO|nr:hypothetical protein [Bombilactobacillus apium]NVY96018.1 hypothetical protein [Bombilactobacillus apium]